MEEKLVELIADIEAEDKIKSSELESAYKREIENASIREKENEELFKEIGITKTPQALKKAMDRARKRTDGTLSKIRKELIRATAASAIG